jgi:N-acetylglucosaminyl-diphospho-decaprenol L-rhamnosyltransferase
VSVAVLTTVAGRPLHLYRLLAGLRRQRRHADATVVVEMRTEHDVRPLVPPPARRVVQPATTTAVLPLAAARNRAAAATDAEHLVFLDVDCIPAPDLVARYVAVLEAHPAAIACGPVRYLERDWDADLDPGAFPTLQNMRDRSAAPSNRRQPPRDVVLGDDHELFWSLSFGIHRRTWELVGGFDTGYVGYGAEDTDFALRARQASVPIAWFAGGTAYHQWHPPARLDPARLPELIANAHRFRRRFGHWPMVGWFDELQRLGRVRFDPHHDVLCPADDRS